jgi:multicomponent Na+:H+ antiporter subunit D
VFTYPLLVHHQDTSLSARASTSYLMGTSKLFLLPAMVDLRARHRTCLGDVVTGMFPPDVVAAHPVAVTVTYVLYIAGIGKAALMPFHNWLPSAMVAPTPVSALLHAVAVVKAGVFCVCRIILSGFGVEVMDKLNLGIPTACVAAFTLTVASFIALTKDDLKARLAYSTVAQLSYVVAGVALLTPMAVQGGMAHIAHHAFSKITLFFAAGHLRGHAPEEDQPRTGWAKMPWTFGAFSIAALSMIGMPPVCGFVSKWYIVNGALQAGQITIFLAFMLSTALNAGYFLPVIYRAFFKEPLPDPHFHHYKEAPLTMVIPLCTTGLISVILGLYPALFMDFVRIFGKF